MSFARPTLQEHITRAREELRVKLGLGAVLPRSVEDVLARVLGLHVHYLHAHLGWSVDQLFPSTADAEYLEQWAAIWGVSRRQATKAAGIARATGTNGSTVAVDTELRSASGVLYRVTALGTIAGGVVDLSVEALAAGAAGNLPAGAVLTFTSPPSGLNATAAVQSGELTGGVDVESDEDLRTRLLTRIKEPPAGGAASDYVRWALVVAGVDNAWVVAGMYGLGTVAVLVKAAGADPVPDAPLLAQVQAALDLRRPVTAEPIALAAVALPVAFQIQLTAAAGVDITALRTAVEASLRDLLVREGAPNATLFRSAISQAIATTPGEASHLVLAPAADVVAGATQLFTFGGVTWS
jgi:uncharacterized phage protein gp47/JayE